MAGDLEVISGRLDNRRSTRLLYLLVVAVCVGQVLTRSPALATQLAGWKLTGALPLLLPTGRTSLPSGVFDGC